MKWGKQRNFQQIHQRQLYVVARSAVANACQVPVKFLEGSSIHCSKETKMKYKAICRSLMEALRWTTRNLPRKLKKKYRREYIERWIKH